MSLHKRKGDVSKVTFTPPRLAYTQASEAFVGREHMNVNNSYTTTSTLVQ